MSDYKLGKCRWCEDECEVYADSGFCDTCDSDVIYCRICKSFQHYESKCRHVFQNEHFEWHGSGVRWRPDDGIKDSFFKLLSFMPPAFPEDLRAAIRSGQFHTWLVAPMIGGGGLLSLYGMPFARERRYGQRMISLGEGEHAEHMADGYRWLVSLYDNNTRAANRTTVGWLNQWLTRVDG